MIKTKILEPFPANSNPFLHDLFHMGQAIGKNVIIMYREHEVNKYLIVINTQTGERIQIDFE